MAGCARFACAQTAREEELLKRIEVLEARVAKLEARLEAATAAAQPVAPAPAPVVAPPPPAPPPPTSAPPPVDVNFLIDGYYGYNFNQPSDRVNVLRAYDILSNNFSLNQAVAMFESTPDPDHGRRFGGRLDLQFGQATEATQGSPVNEPRPDVYRHIFQAYGTYVAPLGKGLTIDFGKWASSLGIESNYTKDDMNYSRSYWFDFLPFYHMGFRLSYAFNDRVSAAYWLVNGVNETEDFNAQKSQNFSVTLKPVKTLSWTTNFYTGVEPPFPDRRLDIFDNYATWNATSKLTLAGEGDYVRRSIPGSSAIVSGGAAYAQYQFTPHLALAGRGEVLNDSDGLFSGTAQTLKEITVTGSYLVGNGFLVRGEWRRDFSNYAFFPGSAPELFRNQQTTATLGLTWWFGSHTGAW
jgi:hypothetical protein